MLALVTVKDSEVEQPGWDDLYEIGTAAMVHKLIKVPDGTLRILVQGLERIRSTSRSRTSRTSSASSRSCPTSWRSPTEVEALTRNVQTLFAQIIGLVPYLPDELELAAANVDDPSALSPPRRLDPAAQDRGEAAAARAARTSSSDCASSR